MNLDSRIFVAGHRGLVGSALVRTLSQAGYTNVITRTHTELDLGDKSKVRDFFKAEKPEYVFVAAAKVGGILANNTYPADFIRENLSIALGVIPTAYEYGVKKLLYLGTSCIYPKFAEQPIKESSLLTGPLEPTNRAYAIGKIAGIELCQAYRRQYGAQFISAMPTNLYGPGDSFDLANAHVLPALIRRFHEAKEATSPSVIAWGSGTPRREFLHVDDLSQALLFLMQEYDDAEIINVGTGEDISIKELTEIIGEVVGYKGTITWDTSKPDGTPRKLLDVSKIHRLGWKHTIPLQEGVRSTYEWFVKHQEATS